MMISRDPSPYPLLATSSSSLSLVNTYFSDDVIVEMILSLGF